MTQLLHSVVSAPASTVYAIVAALTFGECALFVGLVLPGETAALLGGHGAARAVGGAACTGSLTSWPPGS